MNAILGAFLGLLFLMGIDGWRLWRALRAHRPEKAWSEAASIACGVVAFCMIAFFVADGWRNEAAGGFGVATLGAICFLWKGRHYR